ncbi:MAG: hypothetical protein J6R61_05445 [Bacteroidales bacterium]|nr:hypothetical protein [Bacteroidales bacterium]
MNPKVEAFINKKKEELRIKDIERRREHLISLGLVDEDKTELRTIYLDYWDGIHECKFDKNKNKYFFKDYRPVPLDVTDEEYEEILKYAPIEDRMDKKKTKSEAKSEGKWSKTIGVAATFILFIIIIGSLFFSFDQESFIPLLYAIVICLIYYPFIMGFSKIVEAAEKYLKK